MTCTVVWHCLLYKVGFVVYANDPETSFTCTLSMTVIYNVYIGQLLPVQDLHVADYGQSYVLISWSAVFSLDITDSDPDLWYSVTVHNTANTDDETSATTLCSDCTDTSYNFTSNETNTDPCGEYEFRVTAVNAAGHGVQSEPLIWHIGKICIVYTLYALASIMIMLYMHQ